MYYDEQVVGEYVADLWIAERLIVEIKTVRQLAKQHEAQLVSYLTATQTEVGLLINFGPSVQVRRKHRHYKPPLEHYQIL